MKPTLIAILALAACGPSASELRRAQHVVYNAPFATVWNAVVGEITLHYPEIEVEDAVAGRVRTSWRLVQVEDIEVGRQTRPGQTSAAQGGGTSGPNRNNTTQTQGPTPATAAQSGINGPNIPGGYVVRLWVYVKGPPWRIEVGGEGAEYIPGMAQLRPYHRGAADEPTWVQARVDTMTAAIYERLKKYSVDEKIEEGQKPAMAQESTPWANLPDPTAATVIGKVRSAAKAKDTNTLRSFMDGTFTWSVGGAPSADLAITMWKADPGKLSALAKMLDGGCAVGAEDAAAVVCPAGAPTQAEAAGVRAVFRKIGNDWKFVTYLGE